MINKIINSNKLYMIAIVLSLVVCLFLSVSVVESRPKDARRLSRSANQINETTSEPAKAESPSERNSTVDNELSPEANAASSNSTSNSTDQANSISKGQLQRKLIFQNYDIGFFFRMFIFISAFCLVIFASVFVKSLNSRTVMYGYLDTKCGDEERLMSKGHASDYWDEDDEVVMFDAVDFKKQHYKD